jgi:hypothetical protein
MKKSLLICLVLIGCQRSIEEGFLNDELKVEWIKYEFSEKIIFKSGDFEVSNGKLLIRNLISENLLTEYDLQKNKKIKDVLEIGDGPNEFSKIISFRSISDKRISIYEKDRFRYNLVELSNEKITNIQRFPKLDTEISNLIGTEDYFISSGYFSKRFSMTKLNGDSNILFGDYPDIKQEIREESKGLFFQGYGTLNINKETFVFATNSIPVIDFYKLADNEPELIKRVEYPYDLHFEDISNGGLVSVRYSDKHKFGFRSITSSDKLVFILYSGKSKITDGNEFSSGNEIHVYTFEGTPLVKMIFDLPLNVIRLDAKMNVLYALSPMSDDAIYYLPLESIDFSEFK